MCLVILVCFWYTILENTLHTTNTAPNLIFVIVSLVTVHMQGFNESAGVFVYMVAANDADIGNNSQIDYSLAGEFVGFFTVDRSTGVISVSAIGVDFEAVASDPVIVLTVIATDRGKLKRRLYTS